MILILTVADDLHALETRKRLEDLGHRECFIIECDRVAHRNFLSYGLDRELPSRVLTSDGGSVSPRDATVLWFRTTSSTQTADVTVEDEESAQTIIDNDCRGALHALLVTQFRGKWISTIESTYRASDKIAQLDAALRCGFRVPRTLVSQSRTDVLEFFESCSRQMIVKTVVGAHGPFLQTVKVEDPERLDEASYASAPTIFQEYIPGRDHLRLNCFGTESHAALIRSGDIDWRINLDVPISAYPVDDDLHGKVRRVLDELGLEMGIIDLKLTPDGEPVWLEVNPQGQFLFLDAVTELRIAERFASYLLREHRAVSGS